MSRYDRFYAASMDGPGDRADREILRAAVELFGSRGFGATSVRQIAAAAGVTPPLIAYHFGSKTGLFARCIEVVTGAIAANLTECVEQATDLRDMVRRLAVAHLDFPQQHPEAVRLLLAVAYAPEHAQPAVDFAAPWTAVLERVAVRFSEAIDRGTFVPRAHTGPYALTRHLFNLLHMTVFAECRNERSCPRLGHDPRFVANSADPVEDLCDQFFEGAGRLGAEAPPPPEDTP